MRKRVVKQDYFYDRTAPDYCLRRRFNNDLQLVQHINL